MRLGDGGLGIAAAPLPRFGETGGVRLLRRSAFASGAGVESSESRGEIGVLKSLSAGVCSSTKKTLEQTRSTMD